MKHWPTDLPPSPRGVAVLALLVLSLSLGLVCPGCGGSGGGDVAGDGGADTDPPDEAGSDALVIDEGLDSDGDGLPDAAELLLGTSPALVDTDYDGYTDGEEVLDYRFRADRDRFRFNPRIADVPRLDVRVVGAPRVYITHTLTDASTRSFDNSRSVEDSAGYSTTTGSGSSTRTELSATVGSRVSGTVGMNAGVTAEVSASVTGSLARETSMNWSRTATRDHRETVSESRGFSASNDVTRTSGRVEVAVDLVNTGEIAYTLRTLALGLQKLDPVTGRLVEIGQLEPESEQIFTGITSLVPGERVEGMVFRSILELDEAEFLLGDGPMFVRTVQYVLHNDEGRSFDHRYTEILANTVTVVIDRGDDRGPETHFVAAYDPDLEGVPFDAIVAGALGYAYELGTELWSFPDGLAETQPGLRMLDGLAMQPAVGGYWVVEVLTKVGDEVTSEVYNPLQRGIDLADLRLDSNQTLRLLYVLDGDDDGLGERTERALGLDPQRFDTDGDGVGDGEELLAGTDPTHGLARAELVTLRDQGLGVEVAGLAWPAEHGRLEGVVIDWGDGSDPRPAELLPPDPRGPAGRGGRGLRASHTYPDYGEYTVTLTPVEEAGPDTASHSAVRPGRTRIRLAQALVPGAEARLPDGTIAPDLAVLPDGGAVLRYYTFEDPDKIDNLREEIYVTRLGRDAQPVWEQTIPMGEGNDEAILRSHQTIAADRRGVVYVSRMDELRAISADGRPLRTVQVLPHANHRPHLLAVAADPGGRVYALCFDGDTNSRDLLLTRVSEGATREWTATLSGLSLSHWPVLAPTAAGAWVLNPVQALAVDDRGQPAEAIATLPGRHSSAPAATADGGFILGGNEIDNAEDGRFSQPAVWAYRSDATPGWQILARPEDGYARLIDLATGPDGWVYTTQLTLPGIDPYRGLPRERGDYDGPARLLVVAYSPDGREAYRSVLADLDPAAAAEIAAAEMMMVYTTAIGVGADGVWVAWSDAEIISRRPNSNRIEEARLFVRAVRLVPNPRPTAILYDE